MDLIMDGASDYQEQKSPQPSGVAESLMSTQTPEVIGSLHPVESMDALPSPESNLDVTNEKLDLSMRVIMPATSSCAVKVIRTIKLLDEFLSLSNRTEKRLKKTKQRVGNNDNDKPDPQPHENPEILRNVDAIHSLRFIQAGRYEIFVQARGKKSYVFDWLCEQVWSTHQGQLESTGDDIDALEFYESSKDIKQAIIEYAIQQSERDDRITANIQNKNNMSYDNFSLIVSYDPVVAQPKHIDLLFPNYQFGLLMTDNSPGTTVYHPPVKSHVWTDMSSTIAMAMEQDAIVSSLISQFGSVLCPNIEQVQYWKPCHNSTNESDGDTATEVTTNDDACFPTGTLLSLPGSVIYAGPPSSKYRTVLFFSACPDVTNTIPYHPDTQYFAPLLCCDFVSLLWDNLCVADRIYLLNRLLDSIHETKCEHLERHIADSKLIRFLSTVTNWDEKEETTPA